MNASHEAGSLLRTAKAYESQGDQAKALQFYRRTYFYGAGTEDAKQAEARLTALTQPLTPSNAEEAAARAEGLFNAKNFAEAEKAYTTLATSFGATSPAVNLKRVIVYSNLRRGADAQNAFNLIPANAKEKEEAYYYLAQAHSRAKMWPQVRQTVEDMRQKMPSAKLTPKTWVDAGMAARDAKNKPEEQYLLRSAVSYFPNAVEVAGAQFELAWMEHEAGNFAQSSQMLTEHLARYADRDTSNRGKAGYWAARDSERAGKTAAACALYEGEIYRYSATWYGYLAQQRLAAMKSQSKCGSTVADPTVANAVANLRKVTVAPETATERERARIDRSRDLSDVTLFEWATDELQAAQKTARNSPSVNLALARVYRQRGDNVNAFLALAKSYPDYSQMFPEEMGREEWDIFYPLINWKDIKYWASQRGLDAYQVAGLIRQESVFNPRARSGANAYGLMQLILPTAQSTARKYGSSSAGSISPATLYNPAVNIELGTAYLKDQLTKFGRIEYVAAAYNAGPGRIPGWRATLPLEMDEFVEAIPFRETKAYVQGVIRNTAQYRRLYDENGNFNSNVGSKPLRGEIDSLPPEQLARTQPDLVLGEDSGE
jgi:soluble lytic murein transglycosylase